MSRFFITSSGTGIGKTIVTCALTYQLRAKGRDVRALKPIITDFAENRVEASDTYEIIHALGEEVSAETIAHVSPWRFVAPMSPDMAAAREERSIDFPDLIAFCRPESEDVQLIEGIGGAFVPIDDQHLVADWIEALEVPVILVVGSYLGTLSHTIATVFALRARGIRVAALVISESEESPVPIEETAQTLCRFLPDLPIVNVPRVSHWREVPDLTGLARRDTESAA